MTDALLQEAARRSAVLWVTAPDGGTQLLWHVWAEGAFYVVTGGGEQPWPGPLPRRVEVVLRSKERPTARLVQVEADVERLEPGGEEWERIVPLLAAARLNARDAREQPQRWARESTVLRLRPV